MTFVLGLTVASLSVAWAEDPAPAEAVGRPSPTSLAVPDAPDSLSLTLTLNRAIEIALAGNPQVAAAEWELSAAQARNQVAARERLPRLVGMGGYARHQDEQRLAPAVRPNEPSTLSRDILSGDLLLTLPLYTSGRLSGRIRATELLRTSAQHRVSRAREELVFEVTRAFVGILAQERVVESVRFSAGVLQEHLRLIDALIGTQKAARVDRLRTEVRLAETNERLTREESGLAIQRQVLADLLGLEAGGRSIALMGDLTRDEVPTMQVGGLEDIDSLVTIAYDHRSDLLAASSDIDASVRATEALRADGRPSLAFQAAYGGRYAAGPVSGSGDTDRVDDLGRVGLALEIPLFDAGRIGSSVRAERAVTDAARERLRDLRLRIRLEVALAHVEVRSAQERIQMAGKAVEQAEEVLRIERLKYELAQGTILDVLDAQSALLSSQTNYYRALADHRTGLARLRLAIGEGT